MANGADPDISDASGMSPIELAKRKDRTHLAHLMEAHIDKQLSLKAAQIGVEQLYTVAKVAELLSVEDSFVMELIKARKLTAAKLNEQTVRIPAGSIQRYLANLLRWSGNSGCNSHAEGSSSYVLGRTRTRCCFTARMNSGLFLMDSGESNGLNFLRVWGIFQLP